MTRLMTPAELWEWLHANAQGLIVPAGAILAVLLVLLLVRRIRRSTVAAVGATIAGPLVLLWEAQGVFQIGTALIGLPVLTALVFSGVTASVLITLAARAHEHWLRHGVLGPNERLMWYVAVPMGLIVALSADSATEKGLRVLLPILAALVFKSRYLPDEPPGEGPRRKRGSWRWTPRAIGIEFGLVVPDEQDIETVHRERQIRLLVRKGRGAYYGLRWLRKRRAAAFRKLSEVADDAMMSEVVARITRAEVALELANPTTTPVRLAELREQIHARRTALLAIDPAPAAADALHTAMLDRTPDPSPLDRPAMTGPTPDLGDEADHVDCPARPLHADVDEPRPARRRDLFDIPLNAWELPEPVSVLTQRDAARRPATGPDLPDLPHEDPADQDDRRPETDEHEDTIEPGKTKKATARAYWDAEIAAGREPSGADLERASGASDGVGRRWKREWLDERKKAMAAGHGLPLNGVEVAHRA